MRLLVVTQYYWPEPFNSSEICEGLAARGHDVTVLTGLPNYPEGRLYPGYEDGLPREEERGGVRVVRVRERPRGEGALDRVLNYASFPRWASRRARSLPDGFDAVLALQFSPVMGASPAHAYCRRTGAPLLHYVIDLWPESLVAGGFRRGSFPFRAMAGVSRRVYSHADRLAVTSPMFVGYLSDLLGRPVEAALLPQFAEDNLSGPRGVAPDGYDPGRFNVTFAGNVGAAQSVETLVEAASLLRGEGRLLFHVVGSGSELEACRGLAERLGLTNVVFHGRRPQGEMPGFYAASDAMVATFADSPVLGYTLPRKVQSYMAAGRPVVASAPGETARVVGEAACGACCAPGDAGALAAAVRDLAGRAPGELASMGEAGRRYYSEHFSKERFFGTLEAELERLVKEGKR